MFKNISIISVAVLIIYPLILLTLGIFYVIQNGIGSFEIILFLCGYYITQITVCIGLHRLWSHNAYKTNKYIEFFLSLLAAGSLQGSILSWASIHYKHHSFTDTEKDPHSPLKYKNKFKGFLWAHMMWLIMEKWSFNTYEDIDKEVLAKLGKNKILKWQFKYYSIIAIFMNLIVPTLVGFYCGNLDYNSAYAGFLFIGIGRAIQHQTTFLVNSACHFFGTQKYTHGTSGNVWWLALLLIGENWHNYHHAFPLDYRNGVKWYQLDVIKWIIYLMSKIGLAWELQRVDKARIAAKVEYTKNLYHKIK